MLCIEGFAGSPEAFCLVNVFFVRYRTYGPNRAGRISVASAQRQLQAPEHKDFTDSTGTLWSVEERERTGVSSENERTLVFTSIGAFRCVRHYPANWFEMTPDALERLSWNY
jgi:hypothetical protein